MNKLRLKRKTAAVMAVMVFIVPPNKVSTFRCNEEFSTMLAARNIRCVVTTDDKPASVEVMNGLRKFTVTSLSLVTSSLVEKESKRPKLRR